MALKRVDPTRRRNPLVRVYAWFSSTWLGRLVSRVVVWRIDPWLLRLTGSRFGVGFPIRAGLLETIGARTGTVRRNGVIYFHDGDTVTLVASLAGAPRHPGWYHNLVANPEVTFAGEFWRLDRISVLPKPVQQPMPLWIGGNSEAAMRRAGRLGDSSSKANAGPSSLEAGGRSGRMKRASSTIRMASSSDHARARSSRTGRTTARDS